MSLYNYLARLSLLFEPRCIACSPHTGDPQLFKFPHFRQVSGSSAQVTVLFKKWINLINYFRLDQRLCFKCVRVQALLGGESFPFSCFLFKPSEELICHEALARATISRFFNPSIAISHWSVANDVHSICIVTGRKHNRNSARVTRTYGGRQVVMSVQTCLTSPLILTFFEWVQWQAPV